MQQGNGAGGAKQMGMMNNDAGGNTRWKTWQTDADITSRKILIQHMYVRQSRRYRTRTNPNAARWPRVARFPHRDFARCAIGRGTGERLVPSEY